MQAITLRVVMGPFVTELTIYRSFEISNLHEYNCLYGNGGNVYLIEGNNHFDLATKCIEFKEDQQKVILMAIKEYFMAKIAASLKIGPRLIKFLEFDLIIYK